MFVIQLFIIVIISLLSALQNSVHRSISFQNLKQTEYNLFTNVIHLNNNLHKKICHKLHNKELVSYRVGRKITPEINFFFIFIFI